MTFSSAIFLFCFLPLAFLLYLLLPGIRAKNLFLTVLGLVFYAFGQWQGLPLLLLSAVINYAAGFFMTRPRLRRPVLVMTLTLDLLVLGCFKYLNFLIDTLNALLSLRIPRTDWLLPMGISFFTFKAMAYVIDAYRDGSRASRRFSDVLLYISFFPQVASGPITRFDQFSAQLGLRPVDPEQIARGLRRFIVGFGKKALAAALVSPIVDSAFSLGDGLDIRLAWLGAVAYTVQIYFDFSGYSDMSIGLGAVFGFTTPENFSYPYIAASITDFWRRWHISLSSWFKDYLYIPLGGNRRGRRRQAVNKALVFLLCGLWHGASWTFLLWGVWHGVFSALESCGAINTKRLGQSRPGRILSYGYTLVVVCLGFVIFRAADLGQVWSLFRALFTGFALTPASTLAIQRIAPASWLALLGGVVASVPVGPWLTARVRRLNTVPRQVVTAASFLCAAALLVLCVMATAGSGFQPFIYVQF